MTLLAIQVPVIVFPEASNPLPPDAITTAPMKALELLNGFASVFLIAFVTTLLATPLVRRAALALEIIDKPDRTRKLHSFPVAYLGGFAVFLGVIVAIAFSLSITTGAAGLLEPVPLSVLIGLLAITFTGLADDVWGWDPRLKIAGQLVAAAALAVENIGTRVAEGALSTFLGPSDQVLLNVGSFVIQNGALYYWVGIALIAIFVLGGCNATNLIDGLDGLLSGTVAIMMLGFLAISLMMATMLESPGSMSGARIVICLATLGAVLGFLPWNWNPAVIFLGDCGSLQLGYLSVVLILMFGEQGHTHLVLAGLVIFALPIMDTALAIVRRRLAGVPFSTADSNHIHHQIRRATGGVKSAVSVVYLIVAAFTALGSTLAWLVITRVVRLQILYAAAIVLFGFVAVIALKAARRQQWDAAASKGLERAGDGPTSIGGAAGPDIDGAARARPVESSTR
ncbi:MAG: MraY family glycosyltransferase [Phycisphaerales bacterium]